MNKTFWKAYFTDYTDHYVKAMCLAVLIVLFLSVCKEMLWPFVVGYCLIDPINYYFITYRNK